MEILFVFNNTSAAIGAEQALLQADVDVRVMSLPSSIRAGCGICLRIDPQLLEITQQVLSKQNIKEYSLYSRTGQPGEYLPFIK